MLPAGTGSRGGTPLSASPDLGAAHRPDADQGSAAAALSEAAAPGLSPNASAAVVHLYRAEVGRMTTYRQRLDTTTSWALTTSGLITTLAFGNASVSHAAFLFLMFILLGFLHLEGRRFRSYEASRVRIALLERSFLPQLLNGTVDPARLDTLVTALQTPTPTASRRAAIAWRLRSNYLWMFGAVLVAWMVKVDSTASNTGPVDLIEHATVAGIPGWLVLAGVAIGFALLILLVCTTSLSIPGVDPETQRLLRSDRD